MNEGLLISFKLLLKELKVLFVLVCLSFDLTDVGLIVPLVVFLLVGFTIPVVLLRHLMVVVLFSHDFSALNLHISDVLLVLVLVVLHLLQVRDHKSVVLLLLFLHIGVEILHLCFKLFDLLSGVHVEVMNHVLLNLQGIALHFRITKLLAQVLDRDLQLLTTHGHELVFGLGFFLLLLSPLLFLSCHLALFS